LHAQYELFVLGMQTSAQIIRAVGDSPLTGRMYLLLQAGGGAARPQARARAAALAGQAGLAAGPTRAAGVR